MANINENFLNLQDNYLFSTIAKKVSEFQEQDKSKKIIRMGIGDVTLPLPSKIIESIYKATEEMGNILTFKGYPPEYGYGFLKEKIIEHEYKARNVSIDEDEIFISDGAKSDTGNILDIFASNINVAITNPVYPVYMDTNIIRGNKIEYLPMNRENNFNPELPKEKVDIIYLCFPNNPTGAVMEKQELKKWVEYAIKNKAVILYDSAYVGFITENNIPHSIYEIEDAKKVAIEFKSFSKTAGFTGLRCGYTVIPKEVIAYTKDNSKIKLNSLWGRRQSTKFNGVSYIIQKAAEAVYSEDGKQQIKENINYYIENAKIIKEGLEKLGYETYGGKNAPYIWCKTFDKLSSWEMFDYLLKEKGIVVTPGSGFGTEGEGYFRISAFGDRKNILEAMERFKN